MTILDIDMLQKGVTGGDRAVLAKAITLIESDQPTDAEQARSLIASLLSKTGGSHRIAISGVPGVGKSTLIDVLGMMLLERGHKVAVLAVDPSSSVSGGSILGDKTRMAKLSRDERAFIRPSPTGGTLGGVARKTREAILLCEAAGYDTVLVETVGVGQSETVVAEMVDFYLVLMLAGAGDELQGIKRGIIEVADMLAINKADGDNLATAKLAQREYEAALRLMHGKNKSWQPPVLLCSALHNQGLGELWGKVKEHRQVSEKSGEFSRRRQTQQVHWMWQTINDGLTVALTSDSSVRQKLQTLESQVRQGKTSASAAANEVLSTFLQR